MKKFLATFLAFAMVLSMLCLPAVADGSEPTVITLTPDDFKPATEAVNATDDCVALEVGDLPAKGKIAAAIATGKLSDPYAEPVFELAEGTYTIDTTKTINYPLLGHASKSVTIYGNNQTISFTYADAEATINRTGGSNGVIFGTFMGTVTDLTFDNVKVDFGHDNGYNSGIFSYNANGGTDLVNVAFANTVMTLDGNGGGNHGGFFGQTNARVDMVNCSFSGAITSATNKTASAGFIGRANTGVITLTNCVNNASVSDKSGAGFVANTKTPTINLINCTNTGAITTTSLAGGLIGNVTSAKNVTEDNEDTTNVNEATQSETTTITLQNCVNTGAVAGATYVGGLVAGRENYVANAWDVDVTVVGCVNLGAISTSGTDVKNAAGGLLGKFANSGNSANRIDKLIVEDCLNFGAITATEGESTAAALLGIVCASTATITNNVNFNVETTKLNGIVANAATAHENVGCSAATAGSTYVMDTALLTALDGARVRLDTNIAEAGLRFEFGTNTTALQKLVELGYNSGRPAMMFGASVLKAETAANSGTPLSGADFTAAAGMDGTFQQAVVASTRLNHMFKDNNTYSVAVIDISDYAQSYACVGTLELVTAEGRYTFVTEYTEADNARSVKTVAEKALDDTDPAAQAAYEKYEATLKAFAGRS